MADYDNNLTGALFKNDKAGNEKRPDYKGSAEIEGVQYWVSGWIRSPKSGGDKFMSLKFEAKESQAAGGNTAHGKAKANAYVPDEEDPF
jgi:hypothetical protein